MQDEMRTRGRERIYYDVSLYSFLFLKEQLKDIIVFKKTKETTQLINQRELSLIHK